MAFYTVNKHIRQKGIKPEALTREVFDFIFLGKGEPSELSKLSGIDAALLKEMRGEFLYWYPLDLRNSAKELVPNHLTFCIFHHAALFPPENWPRAMGVNGMLMIEGKQMHKSKGNFITMKGAVDKYGADATRCGLLLGAEGMDDPDWRADNVSDIKGKFEGILGFVNGVFAGANDPEVTSLERWLQSKLQRRIAEATAGLEEMKSRTALQAALFDTWNDIRYYIQRRGKADSATLKEAVKVWLRLLAPFAPYTCEELWSKSGEAGFISVAAWPKLAEAKIDAEAEEQENFLNDIIEDTLNILRATKISPKRVFFYTAAFWKWQVYQKILARAVAGEAKMNEVMKELAADTDLKPHMKEAAALVPKLLKALTKLSGERKANLLKIKVLGEKEIVEGGLGFLHERFNAEVLVFSEEDKERYDPKQRAIMAMPNQPAIFIE
jgi:leucyl-tRNA synthetase